MPPIESVAAAVSWTVPVALRDAATLRRGGLGRQLASSMPARHGHPSASCQDRLRGEDDRIGAGRAIA